MKKRGIFSVFLLSVLLLNASLLLLWVVFYYLTAGMVQRNMRLQAETGSEVIISSMERELLAMENTAYELGHDEELADLIGCTEPLAFYDSCNAYLDAHPLSSGDLSRDNALIVFNTEGLFYRLRGNISNTTLKRCFYLMESGGGKGFTVTSNDNSYIASYESIRNGRDRAGYVLMLMDQQRIESFLTAYDDLDYLGVALLSGDRILCSNKELRAEDISGLSENAVFVKEKEVGISGLRLLVWCEKGISARMAAYFRIVMPVSIALLLLLLALFMRYLRRRVVKPIGSIIAATAEEGDKPLPYTGEEYFDSLVDHVNDMLRRMEERERELYESRMHLKETELEAERTLITLLKKQISAHFTVNTLNVVRAMINKGEKAEAARICDELSTLLRYANAADEFISLLEEFYVLRQYIGIMQARYPGRIEAEIEDDDAFAGEFVPRMLLQPVVENAILHGLSGGKGRVRLSAELSEDHIVIRVEDNGSGMSAEELKELRKELSDDSPIEMQELNHVALKNVQRRIRMVCGGDCGISIESAEGSGTTVILRLSRRG